MAAMADGIVQRGLDNVGTEARTCLSRLACQPTNILAYADTTYKIYSTDNMQ